MTNKAGTGSLAEALPHLRAKRGFPLQLQSLLTGKTGNQNLRHLLFLSETPNLPLIIHGLKWQQSLEKQSSNPFIFLCGSSLKHIFYEQNS